MIYTENVSQFTPSLAPVWNKPTGCYCHARRVTFPTLWIIVNFLTIEKASSSSVPFSIFVQVDYTQSYWRLAILVGQSVLCVITPISGESLDSEWL